jgi:hypothetical protein
MWQITHGALVGALEAEDPIFKDVENCMKDAEDVIADAEKAVHDFELKTARGAINGLKDISAMFKVMATGLEDCAKTKEDWIKFLDMISIFNSPASFAYHVGKDLLVNGKQIYGDINDAVSEYHESNWYDFGYSCGNAAAKTFLGSEPEVGGPTTLYQTGPFSFDGKSISASECG